MNLGAEQKERKRKKERKRERKRERKIEREDRLAWRLVKSLRKEGKKEIKKERERREKRGPILFSPSITLSPSARVFLFSLIQEFRLSLSSCLLFLLMTSVSFSFREVFCFSFFSRSREVIHSSFSSPSSP